MVADYISGARATPLGPPNPCCEGREYVVIDLGRLDLTLGAADYLKYVPNFRGRVMDILAIVDAATTDADADGTITAEVSGSAVTGGVVTVTDTAGAAPFTPVDKVFQGTVITADNEFHAGNYLDVAWATTNAFSNGVARVLLVCEVYID